MGGRGAPGREGRRERKRVHKSVVSIISTELNVEGSSASFATTTA